MRKIGFILVFLFVSTSGILFGQSFNRFLEGPDFDKEYCFSFILVKTNLTNLTVNDLEIEIASSSVPSNDSSLCFDNYTSYSDIPDTFLLGDINTNTIENEFKINYKFDYNYIGYNYATLENSYYNVKFQYDEITDQFELSGSDDDHFVDGTITCTYDWAGQIMFLGNNNSGTTKHWLFKLIVLRRMPQPYFENVEFRQKDLNDPEYSKDKINLNTGLGQGSFYGYNTCAGDKLYFEYKYPIAFDSSEFGVKVYRKISSYWVELEHEKFISKNEFYDILSTGFISYKLELYEKSTGIQNNPNWNTPNYPSDPTKADSKIPYFFVKVLSSERPDFQILANHPPKCHGEISPLVQLGGISNPQNKKIHIQGTGKHDTPFYPIIPDGKVFKIPDSIPLYSGDYYVRMFDNPTNELACPSLQELTIDPKPDISIALTPIPSPGCQGLPICGINGTGSVSVELSGGNFSGDVQDSILVKQKDGENWNTIQKLGSVDAGSLNIDDLPVGTFCIMAKDKYGCESKAEVEMKSFYVTPGNEFGINSNSDFSGDEFDVSCYGLNDAQFTVYFEPPFTIDSLVIQLYALDQGGASVPYTTSGSQYQYFSNLYAGRYRFVVENKTQTSVLWEGIKTISQPPQPKAFWHIEQNQGYDIACANDSVDKLWVDGIGYSANRLDDGKSIFRLYNDNNVQIDSLVPAYSGLTQPIIDTFYNYFSNVAPGDYRLEIVDKVGGCNADTIFTIASPPEALQINSYDTADFNGYGVSCPGSKDGFITNISASGGYGAYSYTLNNDSIGTDGLTGLSAGTYKLVVSDENGCSTPQEIISIREPDYLSVTQHYTITNDYTIRCFNEPDSFQLEIHGGIPPYQITDNTNTRLSSDVYSYFPSPKPGAFTLYVTDQNGCISDERGYMVAPDTNLHFTSLDISPPECHGGNTARIEVTAKGGVPTVFGFYNFELFKDGFSLEDHQGPNHTFSTNLEASDKYTLQVTDENGCIRDTQLVVPETPPLTASASSVNNDCNGLQPALRAFAEGGTPPYEYKWYNANNDLKDKNETYTNAPFGKYYLVVEDDFDCPMSHIPDTVDHQNTTVFSMLADSTATTCFGCSNGSITLQASGSYGPYEYRMEQANWQSSGSFTGLSAGTYSVYAKDAGDCILEQSISIVEPGEFTLGISNKKNVSCAGLRDGSVTLQASGGTAPFRYSDDGGISWTDSPVFENLAAGTYQYLAEDVHSNQASNTTQISQPDSLQISLTSIEHTLCGDSTGSAVIEITGGVTPYEISWTGTESQTGNQATNLRFGRYVPLVTDFNNCQDSMAVYINNTDGPVVINKEATSVTCWYSADGSGSFSVTGGTPPYTVMWDQNPSMTDTFANFLAGGAHELMITDSNDCGSFDTLNVPVPDTISLLVNKVEPFCFGDCNGSISVLASGGNDFYTYRWISEKGIPAGQSLSSLCSRYYVVQTTDIKGCFINDSIFLDQPDAPDLDLGEDITICRGQTANLHAGIWKIYEWKKDGKVFSGDSLLQTSDPGTYSLTVYDSLDCEASDEIIIQQSDDLFNADFLISLEANESDTLVLVEYSHPVPDSVQWEIPNAFSILLDEDPLYWLEANNPGDHIIKMTAYLDECIADQEKQISIIGDGKKEAEIATDSLQMVSNPPEKLEIFPNPASQYVTIRIEKGENIPAMLSIHDISGRVIYQEKLFEGAEIIRDVSLENIKPGLYLVDVRMLHKQIISKLIVQ